QGRPEVAPQYLFQQRNDGDWRSDESLWVLLFDARLDHIHLRLRLRGRHAVFKPGDHRQPGAAPLSGNAVPSHRQPDFGLIGETKARLHYADDGVVAPAERIHCQRPADHIRVRRKTPLPVFVADERGAIALELVFFRQERAAELRPSPQGREEAGGDVSAPGLFAAVSRDQIELATARPVPDVFKRAAL